MGGSADTLFRMTIRPCSIALCSVALLLIGCHSDSPAAKGQPQDGGAKRIDVKHGTDPDAKDIDLNAKEMTVEQLLATKKPEDVDLDAFDRGRIGEFERSTYRISGLLKTVVHRKDGDYFLTLQGDTGATAVIEVPDPKLCEGSPILPQITKTRNELESRFHPTDTPKEVNERVTLEGVGFYGWKGQKGSGGRGAAPRLMPGTGFSQKK